MDAAGSYRRRGLEGAIEVEHLKRVLLERELRGVAEGRNRRRARSGREEGGGGGGGRSGTCFRNQTIPLTKWELNNWKRNR